MTTGSYINKLWNTFFPSRTDLFHYGRTRLWLEDFDESQPDSLLDRKNAARITHQFMKIELGIKDNEDISKAAQLKDLYTCRICSNHIAQMYVKKIIEAQDFDDDGTIVQIFNLCETVNDDEADTFIKKVYEIYSEIAV